MSSWKSSVTSFQRSRVLQHLEAELSEILLGRGDGMTEQTVKQYAVILETSMFQWSESYQDYVNQLKRSVQTLRLEYSMNTTNVHALRVEREPSELELEEMETKWQKLMIR